MIDKDKILQYIHILAIHTLIPTNPLLYPSLLSYFPNKYNKLTNPYQFTTISTTLPILHPNPLRHHPLNHLPYHPAIFLILPLELTRYKHQQYFLFVQKCHLLLPLHNIPQPQTYLR